MAEREVSRRELLEHIAAHLTRERLAQRQFAPRRLGAFLREHQHPILAFAKRELQRVGQAAALIRRGDEPIDHEIDLKLFHAALCRHDVWLVQVSDFTVESNALKSSLPQSR